MNNQTLVNFNTRLSSLYADQGELDRQQGVDKIEKNLSEYTPFDRREVNKFDVDSFMDFWTTRMATWEAEDKEKFLTMIAGAIYKPMKGQGNKVLTVKCRLSDEYRSKVTTNVTGIDTVSIVHIVSKNLQHLVKDDMLTLPRCPFVVAMGWMEVYYTPAAQSSFKTEDPEVLRKLGITMEMLNASTCKFGYAFNTFNINLYTLFLVGTVLKTKSPGGKKIALDNMSKQLKIASEEGGQINDAELEKFAPLLKVVSNQRAEELVDKVKSIRNLLQ